MIINLSGTTFLSEESKEQIESNVIKVGDDVYIRKAEDKQETTIDSDWAVYRQGTHIGWIPQLATIQRYIAREIDDNNRSKHDMQVKRYKITKKIRQQLHLDYERNNWQTKGSITNIQPTDNGYSISVEVEL